MRIIIQDGRHYKSLGRAVDKFDGKVAVVTGAASGLGRAMAERFAREGMTVVIADNRFAAAEAVAQAIESMGGRAVAIEVDVTSRRSVIALADRVDAQLGGASILVNNAGVNSFTPVLESEERVWRWVVDVNLFGTIYGLQTFLPRMLGGGREGHVVNVSTNGAVIGGPGTASNRMQFGDRAPTRGAMYGYFATKHALVAISEMLARDLDGTRVGVSVLCPSHHPGTGIFENSARYRPESAGGPMTREEIEATFGRMDRDRNQTYGNREQRFPDECAARVVRAIRERHIYVFTHPETRAAAEKRCAGIMAGFDDAASFER